MGLVRSVARHAEGAWVGFGLVHANVMLSHVTDSEGCNTVFFSCGTPNLVMVIPAINYINETFTNGTLDQTLDPAIKAAIGLTKKTLNRYYSLTDSSDLYHITMGMHGMSI